MMEGTYYKEWSAVLDREMEFKVYGHGGVPVLFQRFPRPETPGHGCGQHVWKFSPSGESSAYPLR